MAEVGEKAEPMVTFVSNSSHFAIGPEEHYNRGKTAISSRAITLLHTFIECNRVAPFDPQRIKIAWSIPGVSPITIQLSSVRIFDLVIVETERSSTVTRVIALPVT